MSLKLNLIILCGLLAHSAYATESIQSIVNRALLEAPRDFVIAVEIGRDVFKTLKEKALNGEEYNAILPIKQITGRTLASEQGSRSFVRAITEIKNTLNHRQAHETIIKIVTTLHACLSYEVKSKSQRFPWKDLRKILYSDGIQVFPKLYSGFWKLYLDPSTKDNFNRVKKYFSGLDKL